MRFQIRPILTAKDDLVWFILWYFLLPVPGDRKLWIDICVDMACRCGPRQNNDTQINCSTCEADEISCGCSTLNRSMFQFKTYPHTIRMGHLQTWHHSEIFHMPHPNIWTRSFISHSCSDWQDFLPQEQLPTIYCTYSNKASLENIYWSSLRMQC